MRSTKLLCIALALTAISSPVLAEQGMMQKGEMMTVMPDGRMMTAPMDKTMMASMMKDGKPMEHCMMMTMGDDGKMMMMPDMKMSNGMMACETAMKK